MPSTEDVAAALRAARLARAAAEAEARARTEAEAKAAKARADAAALATDIVRSKTGK
jgi:hypothetical protein